MRSKEGAAAAATAVTLAVAGLAVATSVARPATAPVHAGAPPQQGAAEQAPGLAVDGAIVPIDGRRRSVDWASPITVTATLGNLTSVVVQGPGGALEGQIVAGEWRSSSELIPAASYELVAIVTSDGGRTTSHHASLMTVPASHLLHATIGATDGEVVGVGEPVVIYLDRGIGTAVQRKAVQDRMTVHARPAVVGAWRWISSTEVHYRPSVFWRAGTTLTVGVDLRRLRIDGTRTWGSGVHHSTYHVGSSLISTVDVSAHTMTVRRDGVVLRTLPVSTGRDKYPTRGGVHIVLEKQADQLFDSRTVGIPTASPDGYFEHLPWSVRISDGGAFVHANPGTVRFQGRTNVSHGCVNLSLSDARWYFEQAKRGDVVTVVHANVGPQISDPGMADWNVPFAVWRSGGLNDLAGN